MLFGLVDFDFLSEALLPEQCPEGRFTAETDKEGAALLVGKMAYGTVLVPVSYTHLDVYKRQLNGYAAMGNSGNIIYVNPADKMVVSIAALFKPTAKDIMEFIDKDVKPLFCGAEG